MAGWLIKPPETIKDRIAHLTVDVWSYGIVVMEMFDRGKDPYHHLRSLALVSCRPVTSTL